jgi:hypothetical protein
MTEQLSASYKRFSSMESVSKLVSYLVNHLSVHFGFQTQIHRLVDDSGNIAT